MIGVSLPKKGHVSFQYFVVYRCEDSEDSPAVLPPVVVHRLELPLPGGVPGAPRMPGGVRAWFVI